MLHTHSKPFMPILLSISLLAISGCTSLQSAIEQGKATTARLFTDTAKKEEASKMDRKLQAVDLANDRAAARNELIREMLADSDKACATDLSALSEKVEGWSYNNTAPGDLGKSLEAAIGKRQFDSADASHVILADKLSGDAGKTVAEAVVSTIKRNRKLAQLELDRRMETNIHHYSLKQALMDVRAYHETCTSAFGSRELARISMQRLTPEEKSAAIDSLMQLRKKMKMEGLNTRSIQHKIDTIIMAE